MFNNLHELIATMPDEKSCRDYLIKERWNGVITCPYCGFERCYVIENGKRFKCASKTCYKKFSVTVGTVMEASNIPLNKWLMAIYLCTAHKKGISSYQLGRDIGIAQKSAWFMLHRIREMARVKTEQKLLAGTVEIDETYMSRKYANDYKAIPPEEVERMELKGQFAKKNNLGAVIGLKQRDGNVIAKAAFNMSTEIISDTVKENVATNAMLMTDESRKYRKILSSYNRQSVNHSKHEWVRGNVHTNGVENFWSIMKRGIQGIYHQIILYKI